MKLEYTTDCESLPCSQNLNDEVNQGYAFEFSLLRANPFDRARLRTIRKAFENRKVIVERNFKFSSYS